MVKIVQTFWNAKRENLFRTSGGYACPEIHWMSWALSCLRLCKYYSDVEMFTDESGKRMFELLGLPYSQIHTTLENDDFLKKCKSEMWVYAKIDTYSRQQAPFLHIDGDIFIWEPFDNDLLKSSLIAQNIEDNLPIYAETIKKIAPLADYNPWWLEYLLEHPKAYNAGILGGNDFSFFQEYAQLAKEFYVKNIDKLDAMNKESKCVNLVVEQYLFYALSQKRNADVNCLIHDITEQKQYNDYCDILFTPNKVKYMHSLGDYKKSNMINNFISFALKKEFPEYWHRIMEIFAEQGVLSEYMNHQKEMQSRNCKTIYPLMPKRYTDRESINKLCDFLQISVEELKERRSKNFVVQDFYDFNENLLSFSSLHFEKKNAKCTPFPLYETGLDFWKNIDFGKNYIFVNPYHQVVTSKYNWDKMFSDGTNNRLKSFVSPDKYVCWAYMDPYYYSYNLITINNQMLFLLEELKSKPLTLADFIEKKMLSDEQKQQMLLLLSKWISYGMIYISDSIDDFVPQKKSDAYVEFERNSSSQVSFCLEKILSRYSIAYNKEMLLKMNTKQSVSVLQFTQLLQFLGFETKAVRTNMDSLNKLPLPAVALLDMGSMPFYCLIEEVSDGKVSIANSETQEMETYLEQDFIEKWGGILILLQPKA